MNYKLFSLCATLVLAANISCNKDGVIEDTTPKAPVVTFDNGTGVYSIKVGDELTIEPTMEYADEATITWTLNDEIVSQEIAYSATWSEEGDFYPELTVQTEYGTTQEEVKVQVTALTPPSISLTIPSQGKTILANTDLTIEPIFEYDDLEEFKVEWIINGKVVCTDLSYTFNESDLGEHIITLRASNIDGEISKEIKIEVIDQMPFTVSFPSQSLFKSSTDRYTFANRALLLTPFTDSSEELKYRWSVDGHSVECNDKTYKFTPAKEGEYTIQVTASSTNSDSSEISVTSEVKVHCTDADESSRMRKATASSSKTQNRVYEWAAAPGQYINELNAEGVSNDCTTLEQANSYSQERLEENLTLSLGGFGGYITVGFDHSIERNNSGYDFAVLANAFATSNEAGIVWVMQDTNGDGEPNDEWYELKGSETGLAETIQEYAVTYFKPEAPKKSVQWIDSMGDSGSIDHIGFHKQDYYYPAWIQADSYTLRGTRLSPNNKLDPNSGNWNNKPYAWGYADNCGEDNIIEEGAPAYGSKQRNGFKISNAIQADGSAIELQYIDFVKVQTGVNVKSGWLGEISTEVIGFEDLD